MCASVSVRVCVLPVAVTVDAQQVSRKLQATGWELPCRCRLMLSLTPCMPCPLSALQDQLDVSTDSITMQEAAKKLQEAPHLFVSHMWPALESTGWTIQQLPPPLSDPSLVAAAGLGGAMFGTVLVPPPAICQMLSIRHASACSGSCSSTHAAPAAPLYCTSPADVLGVLSAARQPVPEDFVQAVRESEAPQRVVVLLAAAVAAQMEAQQRVLDSMSSAPHSLPAGKKKSCLRKVRDVQLCGVMCCCTRCHWQPGWVPQ